MYTVGLCYFPYRGQGLDPPSLDGSIFEVKQRKPDFGPIWLALVGQVP